MKINIHKPIQIFFSKHATFPDRLFIQLVTFSVLMGCGLSLLNDTDFHYTTALLFVTHITTFAWMKAIYAAFLGAFFLIYGIIIRNEFLKSSTFICGLGLFSWCILANLVFVNGLQATPFSPIDLTLVKIDQWMHIDTPVIMAWTHNHHHFYTAINWIYTSMIIEMFGIPVLLSIFNTQRSLFVFYIAQLISLIVGGTIYYFFPTMAPSGVFHSPYFSLMQQDTSLRFYEVHHFLKITSSDGGLIAFPSFHVIWAIILTYPWRNYKFIFYPLAGYNVILIASTVLLGWHYFTDAIGGIAVAVISLIVAEWAWKKGMTTSQLSNSDVPHYQ